MSEVLIDGERYVPERISRISTMPLCALLFEARTIKGETLDEVAAATGISKSRIWELENRTFDVRLSTLQKLLAHYGLSFEQIEEI